jgi:hypothetical protein
MKDSQYHLIERLLGYLVLGAIGLFVGAASIGFVIMLVIKVMTTPPINFAIGLGVMLVLMGIGYCISRFFNYLECKGVEDYRKQYQEEQAKMASRWINRGVTTVESPYIPDEKVQTLIEEFAEYNEQRNGSTFDFQGVSEYLEEKDKETGENRHQVLMDFMTKHELELGDTINYWW